MKPVVRIIGDESDLRAVAREAVESIEKTHSQSEALFAQLWDLHRRRRAFLASTQAAAEMAQPSPAAPAPHSRGSRAYRATWGTLLTIGLIASLILAVQFSAPDRKNRFADPTVSASIAAIAAVIAIASLLVVLVLRVPDAESARVGEVCAVLIGILVVAILLYRLAVGVDDDRGLTAGDLAWWLPAAGVTALLLAGIALRCDPLRRSGSKRPRTHRTSHPGPRKDVLRALRRTAERLASEATPEDALRDWSSRLDALERRTISPDTVAQARASTPAAWLSWLCYDGEISVRGVLPRG